jgi:hypothetical protein
MVATTRRNSGRGAVILASEAGVPSEGRMGEAAACLSADEKERSGKGNGPAAFECA